MTAEAWFLIVTDTLDQRGLIHRFNLVWYIGSHWSDALVQPGLILCLNLVWYHDKPRLTSMICVNESFVMTSVCVMLCCHCGDGQPGNHVHCIHSCVRGLSGPHSDWHWLRNINSVEIKYQKKTLMWTVRPYCSTTMSGIHIKLCGKITYVWRDIRCDYRSVTFTSQCSHVG